MLYVDGLKNIYRKDIALHEPAVNGLSPLQILYSRLKHIKRVDQIVLLMPDDQFYYPLKQIAKDIGIETIVFNKSNIVEKPLMLRQQRWAIEDDSGNETWLGAAFYQAIENKKWLNCIIVPLVNLLVEPKAVLESLNLFQKEELEFCSAGERQTGAGWVIFKTDVIKALMKNHDDLMWIRGGIAWAINKPLYPFKTGVYHCPRIRPRVAADLRYNSQRSV